MEDPSENPDMEYENKYINGIDVKELYSLDYTMAKYILPRLIAFKNANKGIPSGLSEKRWNKKIDQMIFSFNWHANGSWNLYPENILKMENNADEILKFDKKIVKGFETFAKYYGYLWT